MRENFNSLGYLRTNVSELGLDLPAIIKIAEKFVNIAKEQNILEDRDINLSKGRLNSFHKLHESDELMSIYKNSKLLGYSSKLLGGECEIRGAEFFAKPPKVGLASPWHQDNYYWCLEKGEAITIWIACDNVGALNGGVKYLAGTHKLGTLPHEESNAPGSSQTVRFDELKNALLNYDLIVPSLKIGECLVHHSNLIHGSDLNQSNYARRGLTIQVKKITDKYDVVRKKNYEDSLNKQIKQRAE